MYIRYVRNHSYDKTTFRLVGGSLSWSETPYFHLRNGAKVASERRNEGKKLFFKQLYLGI